MTAHANDTMLLGYRWVSDEPQGRCERCSALHGREFYYHPGPGQLSVDDLPRRPLHPNCRCDVEPIMDHGLYLAAREAQQAAGGEGKVPFADNPDVSPRIYDGAIVIDDLLFCNDGRSILDGPAYGNFGGANWTQGRNENNHRPAAGAGQIDDAKWAPIDDMDLIFSMHDNCYGGATQSSKPKAAKIKCDFALVENLQSLPADPNDWDCKPKNETDRAYAEKYRSYATALFSAKIALFKISKFRALLPAPITAPLSSMRD